jgi:hypothetical protein
VCCEAGGQCRRIRHKKNSINTLVKKVTIKFLLFNYLASYYLGDQTKKNEVGGACSTSGRQETYIQGFGGEA